MGADLYRDLVKVLKEGGCHFVRSGKGSHEVTKRMFTVPRTKIAHTANGVLKDAGLPKRF